MDNRPIYVVFLFPATYPLAPHEIVGIFTDEQRAIEACRTDRHGYGPLELDKDLGDENIEWPGFKFPKRESSDG